MAKDKRKQILTAVEKMIESRRFHEVTLDEVERIIHESQVGQRLVVHDAAVGVEERALSPVYGRLQAFPGRRKRMGNWGSGKWLNDRGCFYNARHTNPDNQCQKSDKKRTQEI